MMAATMPSDPMTRWVHCEECGGEGRHYVGHGNDPFPKDLGPCEDCGGTGEIEVEVEQADGMAALSDRQIDDWLLMMERLFGKEFLSA
jgi:DnaJ-class molecular chaperone